MRSGHFSIAAAFLSVIFSASTICADLSFAAQPANPSELVHVLPSRSSRGHWRYFPTKSEACEFLLSARGESLFVKMSSRSGDIGIIQDTRTGGVVRLKDYFSKLSYVSHADINRGFAIVTTPSSHSSSSDHYDFFSFETLQKTPLEPSMAHDFSLRYRSASSNGRYLLLADSNHDSRSEIAIWDFDLQSALKNIKVKLPKISRFGAPGLISDHGKVAVVNVFDKHQINSDKMVRRSLIWWFGNSVKNSKNVSLPGEPIYLSPDGKLFITRNGKSDFRFFSLLKEGKPHRLKIDALKLIVDRLWRISDSSWPNAVKMERAKISEDGRWLAMSFEFEVKLRSIEFADGGIESVGSTQNLIVRLDLDNPNAPTWESSPIAVRHFDYLVSNEGTIAVSEATENGLVLWRSNQPGQKREISYRLFLKEYPVSVTHLEFLESERRMSLMTEQGIVVIDL